MWPPLLWPIIYPRNLILTFHIAFWYLHMKFRFWYGTSIHVIATFVRSRDFLVRHASIQWQNPYHIVIIDRRFAIFPNKQKKWNRRSTCSRRCFCCSSGIKVSRGVSWSVRFGHLVMRHNVNGDTSVGWNCRLVICKAITLSRSVMHPLNSHLKE